MNVDPRSPDFLISAKLEFRPDDDLTTIGRVVDLDAFFRYWALEGLLGYWDGYSGNRNNFFVYVHPRTDKVYFIPWGADHLFTRFGPGREAPECRFP